MFLVNQISENSFSMNLETIIDEKIFADNLIDQWSFDMYLLDRLIFIYLE